MESIHIEVNNEIVKSYHISKYKSGIIHLLINTIDKWIDFHRYSNNEYVFKFDELENPEYKLNIPEIILSIPSKYLCTTMQNKDQISFYWIPYKLIT